jgi:hypothetical protein
MVRVIFLIGLTLMLPACNAGAESPVKLKPANTEAGDMVRLLINETPFPGERGWQSEEDTQAAMLSILWVVHSRIAFIPPGYTQQQIAAIRTRDVIDVITAGGANGQCAGFYRDRRGHFKAVDRVHKRIDNLVIIAGKGTPGKFARLLNYGQGLADAYVKGGIEEADRFAGIKRIGPVNVTGRAYAWMSDRDYYHPGGTFIKITDDYEGSLGGNRFYTLKELNP